MKAEERISTIKRSLKIPNETEFLSLCSSFSQYTGKKIRISFLDKPVQANKFINVVYDEYIMNFINTNDMAEQLSGFMYADLREKFRQTDSERSARTTERSISGSTHV